LVACDRLAFGSSVLGQLLVWEWQSETCAWILRFCLCFCSCYVLFFCSSYSFFFSHSSHSSLLSFPSYCFLLLFFVIILPPSSFVLCSSVACLPPAFSFLFCEFTLVFALFFHLLFISLIDILKQQGHFFDVTSVSFSPGKRNRRDTVPKQNEGRIRGGHR